MNAPTKSYEIDLALAEEAEQHGVNIGETAARAVRRALAARLTPEERDERARRWAEENRESLEHMRQDIEENGLWSDGLRTF